RRFRRKQVLLAAEPTVPPDAASRLVRHKSAAICGKSTPESDPPPEPYEFRTAHPHYCWVGSVTPVAQRDLKRVRTRARQLERARAALRDAIPQAHRAGESIRDIAPYANMSPSKVHDLLKEAQDLENNT